MKELTGTTVVRVDGSSKIYEGRYLDADCAVVGRTVTAAAPLDQTLSSYIAIECKLMRIETVSLAAAAPRVPSPSAVAA